MPFPVKIYLYISLPKQAARRAAHKIFGGHETKDILDKLNSMKRETIFVFCFQPHSEHLTECLTLNNFSVYIYLINE